MDVMPILDSFVGFSKSVDILEHSLLHLLTQWFSWICKYIYISLQTLILLRRCISAEIQLIYSFEKGLRHKGSRIWWRLNILKIYWDRSIIYLKALNMELHLQTFLS